MNRDENLALLREHYGRADLVSSIRGALQAAGKDPDRLGREDIATFDEFHIRGREATRELAKLALAQGTPAVLDIGCGIGGAARTLAEEFRCQVVGLDPVEDYLVLAEWLTRSVGLTGSVRFQQGNALDLPFAEASFDLVWMQHANMNIPDKPRLAGEIARVLRAGGKFLYYEIFAGRNPAMAYPVPWASEPTLSFLETPEKYAKCLAEQGLQEAFRKDVTPQSLDWLTDTLKRLATLKPGGPPTLGLNLLLGPDGKSKMQNLKLDLENGCLQVVQGMFRKP